MNVRKNNSDIWKSRRFYYMKNIIKRYLPPVIIDNIHVIRGRIKYLNNKQYFDKNIKFYNANKDKDLLIIGNGPSLKDIDLSKFKHMDMFAANDFYVHKDFNSLDIKYYFNMDPRDVWFKGITKFIAQKKLDQMEFFFPFSHNGLIDKLGKNLKNKNYIISGGENYYRYNKFIELHKPTLRIINILQILLISANYMGYKNIYLVGFDYSFLAYKNKMQIPHFHDGNKCSFQPPLEKKSYGRMCRSVGQLFFALDELSKNINVNIFNLGYQSSYLDLFKSLDINEVILKK